MLKLKTCLNGISFYGRVIFLLVLFHIAANIIWLKLDNPFLIGDEGMHLNYALDIAGLLRGLSLSGFLAYFAQSPYFFPPFHHFVMAVTGFLSGDVSVFTMALVNLIYFPVLICSVYFIGRKIHSRDAGMISAFIISAYPVVFGISRRVMLDFALMSLVALNICSLLYSDNFQNRKFSWLCGVSFGLGMLTKWTFLFFTSGPLLCVCWKAMRICRAKGRGGESGQVGMNVIIACLASGIISIPWYATHIFHNGLISRLALLSRYIHEGSYTQGFVANADFNNFIYYPLQLYSFQISPVFAAIFIFGLIAFIRYGRPYRLFLFSWLILAYALFTVMPNKNTRHTLSLLPAVALISSFAFVRLKQRYRDIFFVLIILFGLAQFLIISFFGAGAGKFPAVFVKPNYWSCPPSGENWRLKEVARFISRASAGKAVKVAWALDYVGYDHNIEAMRYFCREQGCKLEIARISNYSPSALNYQGFDFVIMRVASKVPLQQIYSAGELEQALGGGGQMPGRPEQVFFESAGRFALPDGYFLDVLAQAKKA